MSYFLRYKVALLGVFVHEYSYYLGKQYLASFSGFKSTFLIITEGLRSLKTYVKSLELKFVFRVGHLMLGSAQVKPGSGPDGGGDALPTTIPDLFVVPQHIGVPMLEHFQPLQFSSSLDIN